MVANGRMTANTVFHRLSQMTVNLLLSRTSMMQGNGVSLDPIGRNLAKECGYPEGEPSLAMYRHVYERVGVGARIVQVYPEESWSIYPEIYETEDTRVTTFERAWDDFTFEHNPFHYLYRGDVQSGIGRFGVVLIGLVGDTDPSRPLADIDNNGENVGTVKDRKVAYLEVFPEYLVKILRYETDKGSRRFGQPVQYEITLSDPKDEPATDANLQEETQNAATTTMIVHWTRIHHLADNRQSSRVFGTPRLRVVLDDVLDIRKVKGSAAEMFYKGGFPGLSFETLPELAASAELDADSVKAEIEAYSKGLQRYIRLVGMTAKSLAPQVADPSNHLISLLQLICTAIKVPLRVFMGSEAGHLASTQDATTWNRRLQGRQLQYLNPMVIQPFVQRLWLLGVLPKPPSSRFIIRWNDLNALTDSEKAKVSLQRAQAILQYVTSNSRTLIPPRMFLVHVLNFTDREADAIIAALGGEDVVIAEMKKSAEKQLASKSSAGNGTNPTKKTGSLGQRNGLGKGKK